MFLDTGDLKTDEIFLKLVRTADAIPEKGRVPAYHFKICLTSDGSEVGECDFRVGNTQALYFGGNIGYQIFEPHRGHHYAGKACRLLLQLAGRHGLPYLYITCTPENLASRRTCEYAGGVLVSIVDLPTDTEMYEEGERRKCVYQISLAPTQPPARPREVVAQFVAAFNRADPDALAALYAEDAVNHQMPNSAIEGRANIRAMFAAEFAQAEMVCIPVQILEDGAWGVLEWRDPLGLRGCGFFRVADGKIAEQRGYWDKLSFLRQHGLPVE